MKIRLVKKTTIEQFIANNVQSEGPLHYWLDVLNEADWNTTNDIIASFSSSDFLGKGSERVIFNIGGNNYRMICKYKFGIKNVHLYVKWIGTHAEYDKLCQKKQQYTVSLY